MNPFTPEQTAYLIKWANQGIAEEQDAAARQAAIDAAEVAANQTIDPTAAEVIAAAPPTQTDTGTTNTGVPTP
jgi:hypothetical protein